MISATPKRFTPEEYHRLTELGFFQEDDRVELIRGEIIQMAAKGTAHAVCSRNLLRELAKLIAGRAELQCQDPIRILSNSEPEPDFAIVRFRADHYLSGHPQAADVLLVIEIADSSLSYERDVKLPLYAEAQITDYWIFNLVDNTLEVYSQPYQDWQGNFGYSLKQIIMPDRSIELPQFPALLLDLTRIFPIPKN